ncbi:acyl-CoA dehydrogenase family protein [Phenylobacterium sp. NIBR 498073]|uniref:acyl-CoA dehydrogenase family protein n=1 Tax=Phenylobacterium sp. NIBR 498073 TaxID=3015177 RepID=UPI0022B443C7|nr:acyl-CoA dehydrogenase family protein [Phenylobacterium sp. NIBR 498073]WGU38372.1 acyl-CoA dehydrogenase family protein [Phenylobacterium sp. NIBR 498073]
MNKIATPTIPSAAPSAAALLQRARAMVPVLAARAQATEDARSVLPETIADFEAAGFFRILQPAQYGGYEMTPMEMFDVAMELAKGCPSSAWCMCLLAIHNWEIGLLDPQAAQDIWGRDHTVRLSSSYAPFGTVERVEGGFRISGRWPFSSGCDHGDWAILGGRAPSEPGTPPDMRAFIVPRRDYVIDDTWHVLGLRGTGSKDVVVEGAFVPEHLTHKFADSYFGMDPGRATFTAPTYRYPFGIVFAYTLAVVTLGMAEGAREVFLEQMQTRLGAYDGAKASEDPLVRQRVALADTMIRSQRALLAANFADLARYVAADEPIPLDLRVRCKWDAQQMSRVAMEAIELLFKASGGRGIRQENPLQRFFRDVQAASNHAYLNADKGALNAGGVLLGAANGDFAL